MRSAERNEEVTVVVEVNEVGGIPHDLDARDARHRSYVVGPEQGFVASSEPGRTLRVTTLDASGNQIRPGGEFEDVDLDAMFPVTGPIAISGVRPGDAVGIEILDLQLDLVAHCWTRPGIGLVRGDEYFVKQMDTAAPAWTSSRLPNGRLDLQSSPHVGTIGLVPTRTLPARDLGSHGGNLDISVLGRGATIWLPAHVDGAGLYLGDVHAGIGDGEVCGTGLEAAADITLRVHHRTDWTPTLPTVVTPTETWVAGVADTVELAITAVVEELTNLVSDRLRMKTAEARLLISQILVLRVCQVVNPRPSVIASLRSGLDQLLGPPTDVAQYQDQGPIHQVEVN